MKKRALCLLLALCAAVTLFTGCEQLLNVALSQLGEETAQSGGLIDQVPVTDAELSEAAQAPAGIAEAPADGGGETNAQSTPEAPAQARLDEEGYYYSRDDVAFYIHTYGRLPDNFMTKKEARELGWEGGGLGKYAPDMCIGGDRFGNYEGALPSASGRSYTECDIDTLGKSKRGAKRIVFSNDGLVYYTDDHYETFTLLYGEE